MSVEKGNFILTRCETEDAREIADLCFKAFPDQFIHDTFFGSDTPEGHERLTKIYANSIKNETFSRWYKVTHKPSGRIAAVSLWKMHTSGEDEDLSEEVSFPWLKDHPERLERSTKTLEEINQSRKELYQFPFCHLYLACTHPNFERQGAASMMLKHGTYMVDQVGCASWVEASRPGAGLYAKYGYQVVKREKHHTDVIMKREKNKPSREVHLLAGELEDLPQPF